MNSLDAELNLESRADLFKALGHPIRLLILNLIRLRPRHGEELAAILHLKPATISHHLGKLAGVGLLVSEKNQYYQTYSLVEDLLDKPLGDVIHVAQPGLVSSVEEDAYRDKVLKTFLRHGRLIQIPRQLKKRQVIMSHIVQEFEPDRDYSEMEVNHILLEFHEDVASLRRELLSNKLMTRERGNFRRVPEEAIT